MVRGSCQKFTGNSTFFTAGFHKRRTFDNKLTKKRSLFCLHARTDDVSGGLRTYRHTQDIVLLDDTLHQSVFFSVLFCFFSRPEGHFVSWKSAQGNQRKCQTCFISNGTSRGENEGQLKRGVWTRTKWRLVVSTVTLSARRLLKLSREQAGQSGHLCSHSGSCLMAVLWSRVQTGAERTRSYKGELMKTFGN